MCSSDLSSSSLALSPRSSHLAMAPPPGSSTLLLQPVVPRPQVDPLLTAALPSILLLSPSSSFPPGHLSPQARLHPVGRVSVPRPDFSPLRPASHPSWACRSRPPSFPEPRPRRPRSSPHATHHARARGVPELPIFFPSRAPPSCRPPSCPYLLRLCCRVLPLLRHNAKLLCSLPHRPFWGLLTACRCCCLRPCPSVTVPDAAMCSMKCPQGPGALFPWTSPSCFPPPCRVSRFRSRRR